MRKLKNLPIGRFLLSALFFLSLHACSNSGDAPAENSSNMDSTAKSEEIAVEWPVVPGPESPKLSVWISSEAEVEEMRQVKQIGVDYVAMGGPEVPWTEESLREIMDRFEAEELTVIVMMIGGMSNTIYGREGRDKEIEDIKNSLRAAGKVGIPVVEYNFYADRLMEGYHEVKGRGGAGMTAFDYEYQGAKDLPSDPKLGTPQTAEMMWNSLTYFLEAVIPVAEEAGVRMALHPNDPPITIASGHEQIMRTFDDWKRLLDLVDSPSNGMTYDPGVTRETGEDPLEVLRYLGSRDRLNHMHYRNVIVEEPYVKYTEVFPDEGQVNMFAVMKEVFDLGYNRAIWPEHERALDYDKSHPQGITSMYPGGGGYAGLTYDIAYAKAMMQAVMSLEGAK